MINDLKNIGITDVFDSTTANLSKITSITGAYISNAFHKANIEFSNEGIKAAAAIEASGMGSTGCGFIYDYEIPVETIDLTFDNPFMFIIREKISGQVWFTGTVYNPYDYIPFEGN